ncbi:MAG: hypothetical protein JWQ98_363 [Chlorobi bacterium]|nr:hypothetical protein [Chlorobiota bacterium]
MASTLKLAATLAGTSFPPFLAIEGQEVNMRFDNGDGSWNWGDTVPVEGKLDVKMIAKGFNGVNITLKIAGDGVALLEKKLTITKGFVVFETGIDVG